MHTLYVFQYNSELWTSYKCNMFQIGGAHLSNKHKCINVSWYFRNGSFGSMACIFYKRFYPFIFRNKNNITSCDSFHTCLKSFDWEMKYRHTNFSIAILCSVRVKWRMTKWLNQWTVSWIYHQEYKFWIAIRYVMYSNYN